MGVRVIADRKCSNLADPTEHAIEIVQHLFISKSQHCETPAAQSRSSAACHIGIPVVLLTIDLDDEFSFEAQKVDGIATHRHLSFSI